MNHRVFIPDPDVDNSESHCVSDFHVHAVFLIRDRFIQRALIEHSSDMSDISTIHKHKRWHITTSPLYILEYQSLVNMMIIPDLGTEYLPSFLKQNNIPLNQSNMKEVNQDLDEEELETKKVPTNQSKRYNSAMLLTTRICDSAKIDVDVFKMVMPQLDQIYQNSQLLKIQNQQMEMQLRLLLHKLNQSYQ